MQIEEVDKTEANYLEERIQKMDALVRATRLATDMTVAEMQRAKLEKDLAEFNKSGETVRIREIESKGFDDTVNNK